MKSQILIVIFSVILPSAAIGNECSFICQNQVDACAASASAQHERFLSEGDQWADKELWQKTVEYFGSMTPEKCAAANVGCPTICEKNLAKENAEQQKKEDLKAAMQNLSKEDFEKLKAEIAAIEKQVQGSHRASSLAR